jgi:hypothetical protein
VTDGDYTSVREAIRSWIDTGTIPGVGHVFRDGPWYLDGSAFNLTPGQPWGAVVFIHIDSSSETRLTLAAPNPYIAQQPVGQKSVEYVVSIVVQYKFQLPQFFAPGETEDMWVLPLDLIIDALKTRLRQDPTLGTGGSPIWQAAQGSGTAGGMQPDIRLQQDLPVLDDDMSQVYSLTRIEFDVISIPQA